MAIHTVNLEQGMPTVEQARIKLEQELRSARTKGLKAIKIIHGYGSSGKGGAIRRDTRAYLSAQKRSRRIREFVGGEYFSPFDPAARNIIAAEPQLSRDSDYSRGNEGITIVLL